MAKQLRTKKLKTELLSALESTLGVVSTACKKVGCKRSTFYRLKEEDLEFRKNVDEISEVAIDYAETALFKQIKNGIPSSTMFYLKTKAKNRGYIETQDVTSKGEKLDSLSVPPVVNLNVVSSKDELESE